jgi:hypothetical protein
MSQIEDVSTLEAIAETHAITRERVRQIVQRGPERFSKLLEPLKDLPGVHDAYPTLIAVDGWLLFTNDLIKPLNEQEGTQWPPLVFAYLSLVLSEGRCAQVTWSTVLGRSQRSKALDIQYPMIVSLDLLPTFNVCMEQVRGMVQGKRQEDTRFPLETLTAAWGAHSDGSLTRLLTTVLPLAFEGVSIDDADVVLHANHKWRQDEQLEAVLIELDEPSHVTLIHQKWCERFPDQPVTIDGVRAVAVRHAERFFSIGRTSTYGLRRWEEERPHLKGGTIRDLVEDLLEHSTVPIHVEDLIEHIQKYRPTTNLVSVKQNLQLETNGRFTFYPGGFVGLGGRVYEQVPAPPARVPGSMMRTHVLERYIGSHLNELTNYIAAHSQADSKRIGRVIDKAIAADRIVLDSDQVIIRINPVEFEPDELPESDELPFSW